MEGTQERGISATVLLIGSFSASALHAAGGGMRFSDAWSEEIWPVIQADFERLLAERPRKQDSGAVGVHYGSKVLELAKTRKEVRNVACNLAWTHLVANTPLQKDISLELVKTFALDMFMDNSMLQLAASADGDAGDEMGDPDVVQSATTKKRTWKIPDYVPRFYAIPIALTSTEAEPGKGEFRRLGMDCAVNGTWLAYKWAVEDKNDKAKLALEALILNWPFDFTLVEAPADDDAKERPLEDAIFELMVNLPLQTERLRDFFGLGGKGLVGICAEVRDLLREQRVSKALPPVKDVHGWMVAHISWGLYR